jgi:ferredoxin
MRVKIDVSRCNGNATCILAVPEVFGLSSDGSLAEVLQDPVAEDHRTVVQDVVVQCPTQAISISESKE